MTFPFAPTWSLRGKLTLAALAPLAFILLLVAVAVFALINGWIVAEAQKKVRLDLDAAREVFRHEADRVRDIVRFSAQSEELSGMLAQPPTAPLLTELRELRRREELDLLTLIDLEGQVVGRAAENGVRGTAPLPAKFFQELFAGRDSCGTLLLSADELLREGAELARLAQVNRRPPVPPGVDDVETRGLVQICLAPVLDAQGEVVGGLYGGRLLNNNLALVDRIQRIVYGEESYQGTTTGGATMFLADWRVATTIRLKDGQRALGTQLSAAVAKSVLENKVPWVKRARVVDEWHLTAYEPILDPAGNAIGALYVGLLERPFTDLKARTAWILLGFLALGCLLGYLLARIISKRLSRPLLELDAMAERVASGEREVALENHSRDEIGHLTRTFNRMAAALGEREDELNRLNRQLEAKVAERTKLLEKQSLQLIQAQEELRQSEKLAAIGSLAAGVAHEINNPAAIIRGNIELLQMTLDPADSRREEVEEILKNTERIALITQNLLTFAREQVSHPEQVQINDLLQEILGQIGHQVAFGEVEVRGQFDPHLPPLQADSQRLRQVFTNLLLNALQAMAGSGTLSLTTCQSEGQIEIRVQDSGPGIPPEIREKIFNPFFTTRRDGTGLGLSISYGIIQACKGRIEVESRVGEGATFLVRLPLRPAETP